MSEVPANDLAAAVHSDRRLEDRHLVHWPVLLSWPTPAGPAVAQGHTLELSFSGMRVASEHNFPLGERVDCRVSVQPWHGNSDMFELDAAAKVVHSSYSSANDGFDVGLHFVGFAGDGKERLAQVVQAFQRNVQINAKIVRGS